ncbi:hypothetical protein McaMca56_002503 [Microsporum canis]
MTEEQGEGRLRTQYEGRGMVVVKCLDSDNSLDVVGFLNVADEGIVAVGLTTAAAAEVGEMLRDRAGSAVVSIVKDTAELTAARFGSGVVLVAVDEAFACHSRGGEHGNGGNEDVGELHVGKFEVVIQRAF